MLPTGSTADRTSSAQAAVGPVGNGFTVTPADLAFILKQIKIAERHSAQLASGINPSPLTDPAYCQSMVGTGPDQIPDRLTSYGLRTVDGSCNNLFAGRDKFAAADVPFPRLTNPAFRSAEGRPAGLFGPFGPPASAFSTYKQKKGSVYDSQPRVISNLIVDQTSTNPAAIAAAGFPVRTQGAPGLFPCEGIGEVQTVSGTPSGPFSITFNGQQTGPIAPDATVATIQTALVALSNLGPADVTVVGSLATHLTLTFASTLGNVPAVSVQAGVTGLTLATTTLFAAGSPAVAGTSAVQTISGDAAAAAVPGTQEVVTLDTSAAVTADFTLTLNGNTTAPIGLPASALAIETALNAAPVNGGVTVVDGATAGTFTVTFVATGPQPSILPDVASGVSALSVAGIADVPAITDFTLTFNGNTTAAIPAGALAADVETALNAAPVNAGVTVAAGAPSATYIVTFVATGPRPLITTNRGTLSVAPTTSGVADVPAGPVTPEQQTLSGTASANFTLDLAGTTTGLIAPTAAAADVATALNAITTVTTTGGPLPAGVVITFAGSLGDVAQLTVPGSTAVTGSTVTTFTNGVAANSPGCTPAHQTLFIPNVTTDVGLSPPYNSLFTFFGQFFDHGVDQTVKSGGSAFVPLQADDPLILLGPDGIAGTGDEVPVGQRFMVLTRAQSQPGPDGILADNPATVCTTPAGFDPAGGPTTAPVPAGCDESFDNIQDANNTDSPWVDQSQTYTSHASHQVFLREYVNNTAGRPVATGKLLSGPRSPTSDGGIGTWAGVKAQAATLLGLRLVDTDSTNIPMIAADPYGKFSPGPLRGLPQYVTTTGLVEGDTAGGGVPVPSNVVHFDTPFLTDIAHNADPGSVGPCATFASGVPAGCLSPDADSVASADFAAQPANTYDDEMLNRHFSCGDGRCNENIALSTIHQIFHSEHDRLVDDIKKVLTADTSATGVLALAQWKLALGDPVGTWNGERLFQAARFVTEMEYQHLVFEEFARKVQPAVRPFHVYSPDINPAVDAEFAHAVYRFGHSMLDDTVARTNVLTGLDNSTTLLHAFLNPPELFNAGGTCNVIDGTSCNGSPLLTAEQGAGSIVMGSSDQVGNELDEFVTETLRNNLLGLPLDLPTINMTRARSEGIPPLNDVRRQINAQTNDGQLAPYTSWSDFGQHLKHPASLINFVAAYGTHPTILFADGVSTPPTLASRRAAAKLIVDPLPTDVPPADAADFMFSTGAWSSDANGVTNTGLDRVDLWVGGLAEVTNLFGGLLGSTFNYVFQNQLEKLQDGDRFYYLLRTPGMNLRTQLEGNSFSELIQRNTDGTNTLKADAFATADCKFQLANLNGTPAGFTTFGSTVADDPTTTDCDESLLLLRKPDGTIQYRQFNTVNPSGINGQSVYQGTDGVDRIFGGNDNDTFWGGLGNDRIEGNGGDDVALGGEGNDIITDLGGNDVPKGGPGNDAIDGGPGNDSLMGNEGQDFINGGANDNATFAGPGNDFIIAGQGADAVFGDGGDDWIQGGTGQDLLQGDHGAPFFDDPAQVKPGNDIFIGQPGENDYDAEGGDDLMAQNAAIDRNAGAAGFDWAFHQYDTLGGNDDMEINNNLVGVLLQVVVNRDRWQETEADSGSAFNDIIKGTSLAPSTIGGAGFSGCDALDPAGVARIAGLDRLVTTFPSPVAPIVAASAAGFCPLTGQGGTTPGTGNVWGEGDILMGGAGSDTITGRGANDIIDGDHSLNVRISVRTDPANPASEIGSTDLMEHTYQVGNPMTLQQAVFSGIVDPGNLVAVRELKPAMGATADTATPADCGAAAPVNCDVAVFRNPQASYTITPNADGSVTVADSTVVAATSDGTDTLWNIEKVRFCNNFDRVAKVCLDTVPAELLLSTLGPATPAAASLSAGSLTFGSQAVATTSAPQVVTVTNTGGAALIISGATLTGVDAAQFTATNNCTTVGPGGSCTIVVTFAPTTAGAKTAGLSIASNAAGSPSVVNLTGTGTVVATGTTISIAGPTDFGTNRIGTPRTKTVRITNAGPDAVTFTSVSTTGPFTATPGDCATVAAGRTCRLNVTYNPTAPIGAQTGTVNVVSSAGNSPTTAIVTGTSRAAAVVVVALRIVQPPAPTALRPVSVSLRVSFAATVRVQVRRPNGKLVWARITKVTKAGASSVRWNLRDSKGRKVKKGSYVFTITVTDASGAKVVLSKTVRVR